MDYFLLWFSIVIFLPWDNFLKLLKPATTKTLKYISDHRFNSENPTYFIKMKINITEVQK